MHTKNRSPLESVVLKSVATVLALCVFSHCTTTSYSVAGYTRRYSSEVFPPSYNVAVFHKGEDPGRAYRVIGGIEIAGGPDTSKADLLKAAEKRARDLGADALVDVAVTLDEPNHVTKNRKTEISAGKTALAVAAGVLFVGLIVAAVATSEGTDFSSDDDDDSDDSDDSAGFGDSSSATEATDLRVRVLRAQAVRFGPGAAMAAQNVPEGFADVKGWLGAELNAQSESVLNCLSPFGAASADVVIDVDVDGSGRVLAAKTQEASVADPRFSQCLETRIERLRLNPPPSRQRVSLAVPMNLQASGLSLTGNPLADSGVKPRSLYLVGVKAESPADTSVSSVLSQLVAAGLTQEASLRVSTLADLNAALQAEKEKDLLGCSDVSCAAPIAAAMGVDLIGYGSVTTAGDERSFAMTIVGRDAVVVARSVVVSRVTEPVAPAADTLVRELVQQLRVRS